MNLSQKLFIDRVVGLPLILLLRTMVRLLAQVMNRPHNRPCSQFRCIVIAKFFGLGSILQSTPLLRQIRQNCPDARIIFVTRQANRPLVERLEDVDQVLCIQDDSLIRLAMSVPRLLLALWRNRVDMYFDLEIYSAFSAIVSVMSLAVDRAGFGRYSATFKQSIYTHMCYFNARLSVLDLYLQLAHIAGMPPTEQSTRQITPIKTSGQELTQAQAKLNIDPSKPVILINGNASALLRERCWPPARYARLAASLVHPGRTVVILGGPDEVLPARTLMAMIPEPQRHQVINAAGKLTLFELIALIRSARLMITNDTGPFHMAVSCGTPTVALFGPLDPRPMRFPATAPLRALYQPVICSPCVHEINHSPCHGYNTCMELIHEQEVLQAVHDLLQDHAPLLPAPNPDRLMSLPQLTDSFDRPLGNLQSSTLHIPSRRDCPACRHEDHELCSSQYHRIAFRCRKCGLLRLDPPPVDDERLRQAAEYQIRWEDMSTDNLLPLQSMLASLKPNQHVLIGDARHPGICHFLSDRVLRGYVTTSRSCPTWPDFDMPSNLHRLDGSMENVDPAGLGPMDLIVAHDCIDLWADPLATLMGLRQALAPAGRLVITFRQFPIRCRRRHARAFVQAPEQLGRLHGITSTALQAWLTEAGLARRHEQALRKAMIRPGKKGITWLDASLVECTRSDMAPPS